MLKSASGKDSFMTWLVLREKATGKVKCLHWAWWDVDWGCSFDYATRVGTSTGTGGTLNAQGSGQGALSPKLDGAVANKSISIVWNDP
jgi:hypothetical protein